MKKNIVGCLLCALLIFSLSLTAQIETETEPRLVKQRAQIIIDQIGITLADLLDPVLSKICVIESIVDTLDATFSDQAASTIAQLDVTIQDCCESTASLVDIILSNTEPIFSKLSTVDSKIDAVHEAFIEQSDLIIESLGTTIIDQSQTIIQNLATTITDESTSIIDNVSQTFCDKAVSIIDDLSVTIIDQQHTVIDHLGSTMFDQADSVIDQLGITIADEFGNLASAIPSIALNSLGGSTISCPLIALSAADIMAGAITINMPGNYCLVQDVTANIIIIANNVCLNLNCYQVNGTIVISGNSATVRNGTIVAPAAISGITINNGSNLCKIVNCKIIGHNASLPGGNAAAGIISHGTHTKINHCYLQTGNGSSVGGNGGDGIISTNNNSVITQNNIITGSAGLLGGNAGTGIASSGTNAVIALNTITTGTATLLGTTTGITIEGISTVITECSITTDSVVAGTAYGIHVLNTAQKTAIRSVVIDCKNNSRSFGIFIEPLAKFTEVTLCEIGSIGANGLAIADKAPGSSVIYNNASHNVVTTPPYDLAVPDSVDASTDGSNLISSPLPDRLANIYT